MTSFLTSDLHFGHANIIGYTRRPYASVEEMDEDLVRRWNDVVGLSDEVWVLGDVAMGHVDTSLELVALLGGTKHLLVGNHDRPFRDGPRRSEWEQRYRAAGFASVSYGSTHLLLGRGTRVLACHFPYHGDSGDEERFEELRPADQGEFLVHGHTHGQWRRMGRMLDVGVDAWAGRPVSFDTIVEMLGSDEEDLAPLPWTV